MISKLLVPLDGSPLAEGVMPWVLYLAEVFEARVTLLHVRERRAPRTVHGEPHLTEPLAAEEYLDRIVASLPPGIHAEHHVHTVAEGDVAASIARHTGELGTDLVILAAHGRLGARGMLTGRIAQQVLRQAQSPIVLLRPEAVAAGRPHLDTLLVPLDGSPEAETVLPLVSDVARRTGARIQLLMVVATVGTLRGDRTATARVSPLATAEVLAIEEANARTHVETLGDQLRRQGLVVSTEVARGAAVDVVVEEAQRPPVSLVAMASHGRSGLAAVLSGSVGASVQARVEVPLLLLNPSRQEAVLPTSPR